MLRTYGVKKAFLLKKSGLMTLFGVTKCLRQIEISDFLHMYAPCSKLPSNVSISIMKNWFDDPWCANLMVKPYDTEPMNLPNSTI